MYSNELSSSIPSLILDLLFFISHELQDTVKLDIEEMLDSPLREGDSPCLFIQVRFSYTCTSATLPVHTLVSSTPNA